MLREVPGSDLYWGTKYPNVCNGCLQNLQTNAWILPYTRLGLLPEHALQYIITVTQSFHAI